MSASHLARQRSASSHSRSVQTSQSQTKPPAAVPPFESCAATASLLLYAQGSSILCLHHDTLAVDRRFEKHVENVQLICVDNVSDRGAGRLVVSYDVGQTAIVWDLFSGQEISRFAAFENITVAAWMRNGNIAFGNSKGEVILFEPSTSEHISARTIYDPITALAPSADCKAYAIGYNNGSILLATLQPAFTILHSLTTQRAPSAIAALAWHASSSKQKSDMLATQTSDGDLRVWSVAKPPTADPPRVIRLLKRPDSSSVGRNWIAWSKNGRIIQHSGKETWSWDVRTKHVTYEAIPTVEGVRGLASYGPTATLFTLGPYQTVQQYDLERPQMVANVRHPLITVPPTPPDEYSRQLGYSTSGNEEGEEEIASPITMENRHVKALEASRAERAQAASPRSTRSRAESLSSRNSSTQDTYETSTAAGRANTNHTVFSMGTQSQMSRDPLLTSSSMTYPSSLQSPVSVKSVRKGSRLKQEVLPSPEERPVHELFPYTRARLNDIPYKPPRAFDENKLTPDDLRRQMLSVVFGWDGDIQDLIRDELSRHTRGSQSAVLLSKWLDDDPDHLAAMMGTGGTPSSLDWMMLALSGISVQAQSKKIGQTFVEKLLAKGDIHAAATILLSLGDDNDAIEVYVTEKRFMDAILLTCLLMPQNWQRQSHLVREWGKRVVEHSEPHLAIRCFSCTGVEPSEPWTSPTAQMAAKFTEQAHGFQAFDPSTSAGFRRDFLAPTPVAMGAPPPSKSSHSGRIAAKNQALKLITSFGPPSQENYKFPGLKSDDRTPTNAPGVTPIAESAINESAMTPGGLGSYRLNNARSISNALSARTATPGGFARQRLPSIGETPVDVTPPTFPMTTAPKALPTPVDSGSDKEREQTHAEEKETSQPGSRATTDLPLLLTSAKYEPGQNHPRDQHLQSGRQSTPVRETPLTAIAPSTTSELQSGRRPLSPTQGIFEALKGESRSRNGSRGRKPDGLTIQWPPAEVIMNEAETDQMARLAAGVERSDTAGTYMDTQSEMTSPPTTGHSYRHAKSPSVSGRSIDQYISSLDEAQYYAKHHRRNRTGSRNRGHGKDSGERKRSKHSVRTLSEEDRGRRQLIPAAKRSPSSPVPMSPDDIDMYKDGTESSDSRFQQRSEAASAKSDRGRSKPSSGGTQRTSSRNGERHQYRSSSRHVESHKAKPSNHMSSRRQSPDPVYEARGRTRNKSKRNHSGFRSPSSPTPMSPSGSERPQHSDSEQAFRFVSSDRERLQAQRGRTSRSLSRRRDASPPPRKSSRARSSSRQASRAEPRLAKMTSRAQWSESSDGQNRYPGPSVDRRQMTAPPFSASYGGEEYDRELETKAVINPHFAADRRRKELAAAELEARRLSLARRPSAPAIPLPGQNMSPLHSTSRSIGGVTPLMRVQTDDAASLKSYHSSGRASAKHSPKESSGSETYSPAKPSQHPRMGLPATPRAMRHPTLSPPSAEDEVPALPSYGSMTLSNGVYQPEAFYDLQRSMSAPIPADLPTHPAYDRRLPSSRSNSKPREGAFSPPGGPKRDATPDLPRTSPQEAPNQSRNLIIDVEIPPALPELQHLAGPPPPPPPPAVVGQESPIVLDGDVVTLDQPELPPVLAVGPTSAPSAPSVPSHFSEMSQARHRRGRSINENLSGKIRSITTRLRSTSRGRNTRSPPQTEPGGASPYDSLPTHIEFGMASS
jgi:hypothetical protein